jgi:hypothetical protein
MATPEECIILDNFAWKPLPDSLVTAAKRRRRFGVGAGEGGV